MTATANVDGKEKEFKDGKWQDTIERIPNMVEERRLGTFRISRDLIDSAPEAICDIIFSKILIVRAEMLMYMNAIEYVGYCQHFQPLEENRIPPLYRIRVNLKDDGEYEFSVKEAEDGVSEYNEIEI